MMAVEHRRSASIKKYFLGPSLEETNGRDVKQHGERPLSSRPRTAASHTPSSKTEDFRLLNKLQTSHRKNRLRRHTDASVQAFIQNPPPFTQRPPSTADSERHVQLDRYSGSSLRSGSRSSRQRFSEDVADRNLRLVRPDGQISTGRSIDVLDHGVPGYPKVVAEKGRYSEGVADRNMSFSTTSTRSNTSSSVPSHVRLWGEQVVALDRQDSGKQLSSLPQQENGRLAPVPTVLERMTSTHSSHGTTIVFAPPEEEDNMSDGYFAGSDLYPISSLEDLANASLRSLPQTPPAYPSRKHQRIESFTSIASSMALNEPSETGSPNLLAVRPAYGHKRMESFNSIDSSLVLNGPSDVITPNIVSDLPTPNIPSVLPTPGVPEPLNVIKRDITPPPQSTTPPPIPRRATGHTTPEHSRRMSLAQGPSSNEEIPPLPALSPTSTNRSHKFSPTKSDFSGPTFTSAAGSGQNASAGSGVNSLTDQTAKMSLESAGIDLTNTTETHVYKNYAPAVTHNVIKPTMHEIRQEHITREIHNHDVFHRILPIKETVILPARHFTVDETGAVKEIPRTSLPGREEPSLAVKPDPQLANARFAPRQFTASTLAGFAEDYGERVDSDGVTRSQTTWIHPPTAQEGGKATGQTEPFETSLDRSASNEWHSVS